MGATTKGSESVLVSWVAVNNDPYEREGNQYKTVDGQHVPGPTLSLLFDNDSSITEDIADVVLFFRRPANSAHNRELKIAEETKAEINKRSALNVHLEEWAGDDPTDHQGIFAFLREKMPQIRRQFAGRKLIIHISPGTPSMQTVWVLMGETGFFEQPFQLVKSYRKREQAGSQAVVPVEIGIETYYKAYMASKPIKVSSEDQIIRWDPAKLRSPKMVSLFEEARRFAQFNVPIMLLGERGTGKTTLASWIRLNSPFRLKKLDGSWPAVACGQYSTETMRSELFGYKKGAFTDAKESQEGLLTKADGDTLFLDEVGDVSRDLQRLLIKVIEEKQFYPMGETKSRKSDFRLITATNLELTSLKERLDPDFYDRINIFTLRIPSLREIPEELPWLWEKVYLQVLNRSGKGQNQTSLGYKHSDVIIQRLLSHDLPGNLRDLFRVAYRVLAAINDPFSPLSGEDAIEYGLSVLDENHGETSYCGDPSRTIARAFADSVSLCDIIDNIGQIPTKALESDLKLYLAEELVKEGKKRSTPIDKLCDVCDRTIRIWGSPNGKKKHSS